MQKNIVLETDILQDKYTEYVCSNYDIQTKERITTSIPMINVEELYSFEWNIGAIIGLSGSGKSTVLRELGDTISPIYDFDKCVISQFPNLTEEEACELLHGVGLSSIPTWLHKPNELSNGEKYRLDLAWIIANTPKDKCILIDEFTSVVNRASAKSMSFSLQRYLREHNLKMIVATCHFDIVDEEWLQPDWIYNLNKQENGICETERMIYSDDKEYKSYQQINNNESLSDSIPIS